jgi:hypothetical protein
MGLKAEGWKKTLQSFGQKVSTDALMLSDDYPRDVVVAEDGNIMIHRLTWNEHTETLHDFEINICNRLKKWLYDPKTLNRNKVSTIVWIFDYEAPMIKQIEQRKRSMSAQAYTDQQVIEMTTKGEMEQIFDPVKSRYSRIDFSKFKDTRQLFPYLVKYVSDFLRVRFTQDMVLRPGDRHFNIQVCSSVAEITMMIEPSKNCPRTQWTPVGVGDNQGRCMSTTRRYSFTRNPHYRKTYSFSPSLNGEAEVNLVYMCHQYYTQGGYRDFFVPCVDTDIIPLFLLNYKQMIPDADVHILLDEGTSKYRKEEFAMNVRGSIAEITKWFNHKIPSIEDPILFICCWMVLTGTDYVEHISGLDADKLITFLSKQGGALIGTFDQQVFFNRDGGIVFSEHLVYQLVMCYHSHYPESIQGKADFQALLKKYPPRTIEDLKILTKDKRKKGFITSSDQVIAQIRRASYNVHYWEKGARGEPYLDAFSSGGPGQAPLFGYYFDQNNDVAISNMVARSG